MRSTLALVTDQGRSTVAGSLSGTPKNTATIQLAKPTNSGSEPATVLRP
jgi:hypothetical protein